MINIIRRISNMIPVKTAIILLLSSLFVFTTNGFSNAQNSTDMTAWSLEGDYQFYFDYSKIRYPGTFFPPLEYAKDFPAIDGYSQFIKLIEKLNTFEKFIVTHQIGQGDENPYEFPFRMVFAGVYGSKCHFFVVTENSVVEANNCNFPTKFKQFDDGYYGEDTQLENTKDAFLSWSISGLTVYDGQTTSRQFSFTYGGVDSINSPEDLFAYISN